MASTTTIRNLLAGGTALATLAWMVAPAAAQSTGDAGVQESAVTSGSIEAAEPAGEDIVVTGSRIRRAATETVSPVVVIDQQSLTDRGFVSAAEALNEVTSIRPALNQADGSGASAGSGQQFPNLFGLGPGRTLTLLNGRRMATTSSGLGDSQVDANIIPLGLLDRVEVVQAGGAVVYGSDAIAGVVNYVLKDDFEGIEIDGQGSAATRHRYGQWSARLTAGSNFAGGRGNIAVNAEYSTSPTLRFGDRRLTNLSRLTQSNPADTGPADGIPSVREVLDARFWEFNANGLIFSTPAPVPNFLLRVNGTPSQFDPSGNVVAYNPGNILGVPFASGGEGFRYSDLAGLRTGIERATGTAIAHYDLTDAITLRGEFLLARTIGEEVPQGNSRTILNSAASGAGPITFTRNNAFLTPAAISALSSASPAFAAGGPLFLSKYFLDLTPDGVTRNRTDTARGVIGLEGEFQAMGGRDFYWTASVSHAVVDGSIHAWGVRNARFANAINAVRNGSGQIVCGINADASTANDDASCAPINPFGAFTVSDAARNYVSVRTGQDYRNKQTDALATLGGDVVRLPAGMAKFSVAYEHRDESVDFVPLEANQLGLTGSGTRTVPQSGEYNTDELSGEVLIPIVGGDFTLPLIRALEFNSAVRHVDNSIAGKETLWSLGARWEPLEGVTLRGSRSRNFRAPTLTQLFAPSSTTLGSGGVDPCDADRISSGPNPAQRRASCLALFQANPLYGTGGVVGGASGNSAPVGSSAEARLAAFQNRSENFTVANITSGGNPNLRNEISKTWTYGVVVQPRFLRGLTIVADRIEVDLTDGLSPFTTADFAAACYDDASPDPAVCSAFQRLAVGDGTNAAGTTIAGTTTTFNAGVVRFRGEVFNVNYQFGLGRGLGRMEIGVEATHTGLLTTSVTGNTFTRTDNTALQPDWSGRLDVRYTTGPFRLTYQLNYLDKVLSAANATIENTPTPILDRNIRHDIGAQYDFGPFQIRAGVNNFTDEEPSYPSFAYGDIIGRQVFVGLRVKL